MAKAAEVGSDDRKVIAKVADGLRPKQGTMHILGVLLLIAAALGIVAAVAYGILSSRTAYFQQRNLRELDRVASELKATSDSLAQVAALHFVPQQIHFSLSPQLECLVATTEIIGARERPITITYHFTDPTGLQRISSWYAEQATRSPAAGAEPAIAGRPLPPDICGYRRPLGQAPGDSVAIDGTNLTIARTVRLSSLLWSMTPSRAPASTANCTERGAEAPGAPADTRSFIRNCFELAAREDLQDQSFSRREPLEREAAMKQSIESAFDSNSIRINASTPMDTVDFDASLEIFDAIQIVGHEPDHPERPRLLFQAGRVPAAIEGEEFIDSRMIGAMLGVGSARSQTVSEAPGTGRLGEDQRSFLFDSSVDSTRDLILFQRTAPRLAGLDCSPCRIVGVIERNRFDRTVRKIDGIHATIFLIGLLTLIGLIPLLQLKLRRRLDPTSRTGQHILWFSLTLLAASAAVAGLAIWASAASRNSGAQYAREAIDVISRSFLAEMSDTLEIILAMKTDLTTDESTFPAPLTLPTPELLERGQPVPGMGRLEEAWRNDSHAAVLETVSFFRSDGFMERGARRLATSRFPAFGTNIAGRSYFGRARNCDYDQLGQHQFVLDRVFARPDGAPRTIWLLPTKRPCRVIGSPAGDGAPLRPAATSSAAKVEVARESFFHDPTRRAFILASGSLRTFLRTELAPGFDYAVVDPGRLGGQANVLFHSRSGAELVERFENEIDDPEQFNAIVRGLLNRNPQSEVDRNSVRLDTQYRGQPARLTLARLPGGTQWVLVIIEDRNDAGYAIWRAATFGYGIWFAAVLTIVVMIFVGYVQASKGRDRRPVLWLWPRNRLISFTPPRIERHARFRVELGRAAARRDEHIEWVLPSGVVGVLAAEGASRVLFAFAASLAILAARAYFRGLTTLNDEAARRLDRQVILAAIVFLGLAVFYFIWGIVDEYYFESAGSGPAGEIGLLAGRVLLFVGSAIVLFLCLQTARPYSRNDFSEDPSPAAEDAASGPSRSWMRHPLRRWDIGWMAALVVLGGLPATAGFLDSQDYDRRLAAEREASLHAEAIPARRQAATRLHNMRIVPLPEALVGEIADEPLSPASRLGVVSPTEGCLTLSCLAIQYLGLREQALEFSDFAPFQMRDIVGSRLEIPRLASLLILVSLPLLGLLLALVAFRHQYFRRPPILSPGKNPKFDSPLSLTRADFVADALIPAAQGKDPRLPFAPPGGNLQLILGVGLDIREDLTPDGKARVGDQKGIVWVDLLDPPAPLPEGGCTVVIGNLDLALQVPDEAVTQRAYRIIREVAGTSGARTPAGRQIFLLAAIDPLDRISLLWKRHGEHEETRLVEGWRWAELFQNFTMYPIRRANPLPEKSDDPPLLRRISEELSVLDASFAGELRDELRQRMEVSASASTRENGDDDERIVSFISEQMSDHYHKLWASSSEEERVMLHRIASDCHLKMHDSLALRSLVARGLLIRVPEYRLMNRSFTGYVLRVGAPSEIQRSAQSLGGVDRIWPVIRFPLAAIAGASVLLLQFVAPASGSAAVGALPALLALIPALLGKWLQERAATN